MTDSKIEWTDKTWNPTRGCRRISPGCGGAVGEGGCYAERQAARFSGPGQPYEGLLRIGVNGPRWTGKGALIEHTLLAPLRWRTPVRIFVDSMSDLFFEGFTDEQIDQVLAVMLLSPQHTFQVLTKRADRMREYLSDPALYARVIEKADALRRALPKLRLDGVGISNPTTSPAPWIWWGVSVENQEYADKRVPDLLATPAAVRFVSAEPLLGPVDFTRIALGDEWTMNALVSGTYTAGGAGRVLGIHPALSWVIVGGESGPGSRPFDVAWARSLVSQCKAAKVACFVKQLGADPHDSARSIVGGWAPGDPEPDTRLVLKHRKGGDTSEWDQALRVREFPTCGGDR